MREEVPWVKLGPYGKDIETSSELEAETFIWRCSLQVVQRNGCTKQLRVSLGKPWHSWNDHYAGKVFKSCVRFQGSSLPTCPSPCSVAQGEIFIESWNDVSASFSLSLRLQLFRGDGSCHASSSETSNAALLASLIFFLIRFIWCRRFWCRRHKAYNCGNIELEHGSGVNTIPKLLRGCSIVYFEAYYSKSIAFWQLSQYS